jgi:hypothetical protein
VSCPGSLPRRVVTEEVTVADGVVQEVTVADGAEEATADGVATEEVMVAEVMVTTEVTADGDMAADIIMVTDRGSTEAST